jgi:phage baseplate assembly protein W
MSLFTGPQPAFRLATTHYGDNLQDVAAREMGDANRWTELIWLNSLVSPYITDDSRRVTDGVILSGSIIRIPAPAGVYTDGSAKGQVFERDCRMTNKRLMLSDSGDIAVAAGVDNLSQQLKHRVITPMGQATRHPSYGCLIWRLVGKANGPVAGLLGSRYVRAALVSDYRVSTADRAVATVSRDSVRIDASVMAIEGGYVDLLVDTTARPT